VFGLVKSRRARLRWPGSSLGRIYRARNLLGTASARSAGSSIPVGFHLGSCLLDCNEPPHFCVHVVNFRPDPIRVWAASLGLAVAVLRRQPVQGLKRLVLPVSYWRTAEFAYVWGQLAGLPGGRILDLGSPKELAILLARHRKFEVVSTDILSDEVEVSERYAWAIGATGEGAGCVRSEVQDGRALTYASDSFDAAFSVSVLEHIPENGDTDAIRALVRVVKPGGIVVVTTPYDVEYRETFVNEDVYERSQQGSESVFFERHYDEKSLRQRLLEVEGARVESLELWGEGRVRMERLMNRLGPGRIPLHPFEPLLSAAFLRRVRADEGGHPMAVFFTLRKLEGRSA
jgi:SAM-dependent methyltransferase